MDLFLAIKRIPSQDPAVRAAIEAKHVVPDTIGEILPAANLKDPEKIAASVSERTARAKVELAVKKLEATGAIEDEYLATAKDGGKGQLYSIAWTTADVMTVDCRFAVRMPAEKAKGEDGNVRTTRYAFHEAGLLSDFFSAIDPTYSLSGPAAALALDDDSDIAERIRALKPMTNLMALPPGYTLAFSGTRIVAHHASSVIRFIQQRAVINSVRLPVWWPTAPWTNAQVYCTSEAWVGTGGRSITLPDLCHALELPDGIYGDREVWDAVRNGEYVNVIDANVFDVHRLRACFRRLNFLPPATEAAA